MERVGGATCSATEVCFRLRDHDRRYAGVRVETGAWPRATDREMAYRPSGRFWELCLPRPAVHRVEYKFHVRGAHDEWICDPDNPRRVPGGWGDSSELRCDDYREPEWLDWPEATGRWRETPLPLGMTGRSWSPPVATGNVLVAHDGPDYERYGRLAQYSAAMMRAGRVPPYHLVLLPAVDRDERYSASPAYARALADEVLPAVTAELRADGPVIGAGSSLGALAMLHCQRRHPGAFAGLFLQSGSFFRPRYDRHDSGFGRYLRIVRFTGRVHRRTDGPPVPVSITCGQTEENRANNADMAAVLHGHGYDVTYAEVPDGHNWIGWRDAYDPYLTSLIVKVFE